MGPDIGARVALACLTVLNHAGHIQWCLPGWQRCSDTDVMILGSTGENDPVLFARCPWYLQE